MLHLISNKHSTLLFLFPPLFVNWYHTFIGFSGVGGSCDGKFLSFNFCRAVPFFHFWKTLFLGIVFLAGKLFFFFSFSTLMYKTTALPWCCRVFFFFVIHVAFCWYLCIWMSRPFLYSLQTGFSKEWHSSVGSPGWWNYLRTCNQPRLELGHMTLAESAVGSTIGEPVTRGLGRLITRWRRLTPTPCSVGFDTE